MTGSAASVTALDSLVVGGRTLTLRRAWPASPEHLVLEYLSPTGEVVAAQWLADPERRHEPSPGRGSPWSTSAPPGWSCSPAAPTGSCLPSRRSRPSPALVWSRTGRNGAPSCSEPTGAT